MNEWSEQIIFHPWVGSNYSSSRYRVLLLGDSHYGEETEAHNRLTQDVITYWCLERKQPGRFFTCIIWTLFGNRDDMDDKFSKVAFYNYVQRLMPEPRRAPSRDDYEAAKKPFIEVLNKLSPDFVISFGEGMTWHFPCIAEEDDSWRKDIADETHDVWISAFELDNHSIPLYSLPHPSGNKFNMRTYHEYFNKHGLTL